MSNPHGRMHPDEPRSFDPDSYRFDEDRRREEDRDWRGREHDRGPAVPRGELRDDDRFLDSGGQPGGSHYYADRRERFEGRNRGYGFEDTNLGTGGYGAQGTTGPYGGRVDDDFRGDGGYDDYDDRDDSERPYYRERSEYGSRAGSSWSAGQPAMPWGEPRRRPRGPHYGKGPQGFKRSDERIKELVSEALADDDEIDATNLTVDVTNGEVTLGGTIEDRRTKRMAEDCVERVRGVVDVQNQIRVRGGRGDRTSGAESADEKKHLRS